MKKNFFFDLLIIIGSGLSLPAWAQQAGSVSGNILSVMDIATNLIFGLCYIVSIILACMTFVFFRRYRKNRVETPLGKVIWTLLLACVIAVLPFVAQQLTIYKTMDEANQLNSSD